MYAEYFGFRDLPFRQLSDPRHVYLSAGFDAARSEVLEALRDRARLILLTGHPGTGKTKLLLHLRACLDDRVAAFYLPFSALRIEEFIRFTASAMSIELPGGPDLFAPFQIGLRGKEREGRKPIVLIDDAEGLGCDVLENLIELFQLGPGEEPLAQIVLAAHPEFEYTLERPELHELEANLARLSRLRPLAADDVEPYLLFALRAVGYEGDAVFTPEAVRAIAAFTRGIPQLINTLSGAALMVAYSRDIKPVTAELVEAAVTDMVGFAIDGSAREAESWESGVPAVALAPTRAVARALRRRRGWPMAAAGIGGGVALMAAVMLFGTAPFRDSSATAKPRLDAPDTAATRQIAHLNVEVEAARVARERLESELARAIDERDALALRVELAAKPPAAETPMPVTTPSRDARTVPLEDAAVQSVALTESPRQPVVSTAAAPEPAPVRLPDPPSVPAATTIYEVRRGDTLWRIARSHGVTVPALEAANRITGARVMVGQRLVIPVSGASEQNPSPGQEDSTRWYVVRKGDSLYGIGRKFESSVEDLLRWNQLANAGQLHVGQRLRLFGEGRAQ